MAFPRTYGFYQSLLRIRIFYLYCASVLFVAVCSGLWWYLLFQPATNITVAMQQQINHMYAQVDELRKSERTLAGIAQSIDALKQNVETHSEKKMRKHYMHQSLSLITECAQNSGITIGSCKLCGEREDSGFCVISISGDFKGSLDQMIAFFDAMKNSKQIIDVFQGEMVRIDSGIFSLHTTLNLYYV